MNGRRSLAALAAAAAALVVAPTAGASTVSGTVLSVNRAHHVVRIVNARHDARSFAVRGAISAAIHTGSRVQLRVTGRTARRIRLLGTSSRFLVHGRVARHAMRLADGSVLVLGSRTVTVVGFVSGDAVDADVAVSAGGDVTVVIRLEHEGTAGCSGDCPVHVEGHVTGVDTTAGTFSVGTGDDGSGYTFSGASADVLASLHLGTEVAVAGHGSSAAGYTAVHVDVRSDSGNDCDGGRTRDFYGVVHEFGDGQFVLGRPGDGLGTVVLHASAELLASLALGEIVHVVAHRDGDAWVATSADEIPLPPMSVDLVARVRSATDAFLVVGGAGDAFDCASGTPTGLVLWGATTGLACGDRVRVHAHRDAPEHWVLDSYEKLPGASIEINAFVSGVNTDGGTFTVLRAGVPVTLGLPSALAGIPHVGDIVHVVAHESSPGFLVADLIVVTSPGVATVAGTVWETGPDGFVIVHEGIHWSFAASPGVLATVPGAGAVIVHAHRDAPEHWVADSVTAS
jgi:hypothetical protein